MATPVLERALEAPDGSRKLFSTSRPYLGGTVVLFYNGLASKVGSTWGWTELGQNRVELTFVPEVVDSIQFFYQFQS